MRPSAILKKDLSLANQLINNPKTQLSVTENEAISSRWVVSICEELEVLQNNHLEAIMDRTEKTLAKILGEEIDAANDGKMQELAVDLVISNPYQPRKLFDENKLQELANSIKEHGVMQPILARKTTAGYELIAGERRLRACKLAGLASIPAVIRNTSDKDLRALALVENVQREDLTSLEKAKSLATLRSELQSTAQVAQAVGMTERTIERFLRIEKEITTLPDLAELLVTDRSADFTSLYDLTAIAQNLRKLARSNKREYERTLKRIKKTGLKSALPRLKSKFDTGAEKRSDKPETPPIYVKNGNGVYVLTVSLNMASHPDAAVLKQYSQAFTEFMRIAEGLNSKTLSQETGNE